jgi:pyruvate/2-oxoglutarate dehydrogenase complex dihydrolipoamide dehydrogenase (E3) component
MTKTYDVVVIGGGTAVTVAAMRTRAGGKTVAVIDFRPLGGTCALRGCDPKKCLLAGPLLSTMFAKCMARGSSARVTSLGRS